MRGLMMAAALMLLTAAAARAESCARSVDELSRRYALAASDALPGRTAARPFDEDATEPALSGSSVPPAASPGLAAGGSAPATGSEADPQHLAAATRAEAEGLLQSALDADARGRGAECFRRLDEARSLLGGG